MNRDRPERPSPTAAHSEAVTQPRSEQASSSRTAPTSGSLDELLDELPSSDHHRGRFGGYQAANRARRQIIVIFAIATCFAVGSYYWYVSKLEYERKHPFVLEDSPGLKDRPREIYWSEGEARLGISREAPGAQVIVLPDMELHLPDDLDHAQVVVNVQNKKTVSVQRAVGDVVVKQKSPAASNDASPGSSSR